MIKKILILLACIGALSACKQAKNVGYAFSDLGSDITQFGKNVGSALHGEDFDDGVAADDLPVLPRYCYKAASDILCYNQRLIGQDNRLVAYQEPDYQALLPLDAVVADMAAQEDPYLITAPVQQVEVEAVLPLGEEVPVIIVEDGPRDLIQQNEF